MPWDQLVGSEVAALRKLGSLRRELAARDAAARRLRGQPSIAQLSRLTKRSTNSPAPSRPTADDRTQPVQSHGRE